MGNASIAARAGSESGGIISIGDSLDLSGYERRGSRIKPGAHKCLATNPPFGSKTPIRDEGVLKRFELSRINGSSKDSLAYSRGKASGRPPDVLFIEANVRLLKPGEGRLAIVCPYQILSGPQTYYVRDWIIRNCRVLSVIDLPPETFQPHTGTKTSLLVVKRRKEPLFDRLSAGTERIFRATPKWIGHDRRGNAIYKKLPDGTLSTEILSDFDEVEGSLIRFYENPKLKPSGSECFSISIKDVLKDDAIRLNAKAYRHFHGSNAIKTITKPGRGWNVELLENLVEDVFCPGRFKRDYTECYDGAVPFLGGSDITGNIWETEKWLRHDDPKLDRLAVRRGWVLVTRSGATGVVSMVPDEWDGFAMSEHVIRIIPSERVISGHYIHSYLSTPYCQQKIKSSVFGSVIDEINPSSLKKLEVPIPPKDMLEEITASAKAGSQARSKAIAKQKSAVFSLSAALDSFL